MLTIQELKTRAPAALAITPAPHCSPRYSMIPTINAIQALSENGYVPVEARQDSVADDRWGRASHARHMIKMRMAGTERYTRDQMRFGVVPEIIIINSSDASCPFEMELGMFRQVCSNGLVAFRAVDSFNFVHKKITVDDVVARARALSANSKPLFDKIQEWSRIRLNHTALQRFAEQALTLRVGEARAKSYDAMTLVAARRAEDEEPTLWNVFNRAQENGMQGAVSGKSNDSGRLVRARPINAIGAELDFNRQLWSLTEKWAEIGKKVA